MRAEPKHWWGMDATRTEIKTILGEPGFGMFIECELTDPPSLRGRTVMLYLSPEDVDSVMRETKRQAIRERKGTLSEAKNAKQ